MQLGEMFYKQLNLCNGSIMRDRYFSILLIEDDLVDQMAFKRAVKDYCLPYHYMVAGSVSYAFELLSANRFDAVVSDLMLGDGDFFDLLEPLMAKNIPIIVTTAADDVGMAIRAIKGGADEYIIKDREYRYLQMLPAVIEKAVEYRMSVIERQRAEEALQHSEERFRAITSTAQDGIILMDSNGRIDFWNKSAEEIFGYSSREVLGQDLHFMLAPVEDYNRYKSSPHSPKGAFDFSHTGRTIELTGRHKNGTHIPIEVTLSQFTLQNKLFVTGIVRDITQRKKSEQELRQAREAAESANHAKSQFLANISHEIRTPLSGITGMAELLLHTPLDSQQHEYLSTIVESARLLLNIINDLLDLSKIEADKMPIDSSNFELLPLLNSISLIASMEAAQKNLDYKLDIDPAICSSLYGDPLRLRQVLLNLLNNAIKFNPSGQGHSGGQAGGGK
jgi:PAS domain S-box-containing protein